MTAALKHALEDPRPGERKIFSTRAVPGARRTGQTWFRRAATQGAHGVMLERLVQLTNNEHESHELIKTCDRDNLWLWAVSGLGQQWHSCAYSLQSKPVLYLLLERTRHIL
jgi:hypothetical protein